jgi:hypothetical protein
MGSVVQKNQNAEKKIRRWDKPDAKDMGGYAQYLGGYFLQKIRDYTVVRMSPREYARNPRKVYRR